MQIRVLFQGKCGRTNECPTTNHTTSSVKYSAPSWTSRLTIPCFFLLVMCLCVQNGSGHLGRIYKSTRSIDQLGSNNRSEGRKFPILRALVSQFISERSSRDMSPATGKSNEEFGTVTSAVIDSTQAAASAFQSQRLEKSSTGTKPRQQSPIGSHSSNGNKSSKNQHNLNNHSSIVSSGSNSVGSISTAGSIGSIGNIGNIGNNNDHTNNQNNNNNMKTIQHIIEDINSQNSKISTKRRKHFLVNILSRMLKSVNFTELSSQMRNGISSRASCWACNALAGLFLSPVYSKEMMTMAVNTVCTSFRLQSPRVCTGIVDSFKDDLDYIRTHTTLKHGEMCGVIFGMDCARKITKNLNWTISIPERVHVTNSNTVKRSDVTEPDDMMVDIDYRDSGYKSLTKLVQITDIHVDPYYEPGSEANCGEPLCCRSTNGPAKSKDRAAGTWGDYRNCDTPVPTLRHVLKHINEIHSDAEYWIWTGDVAPHDIWNVTRHEVISQMKLVTNLIKQYARVPVYPVIGNHEGVPVNSFPPPEIKGPNSVSWLYDTVAEEWAYWLPDDALQTLRYGGYYTVKARDKMRIICINTNYCARLNPWSLFNPVDPANQLKWLGEELFKAEQAGDKVHIIGHIPPDNRECTQAWLYNFLRIIDRFNDTVLAQYYGHTHRDEYRLFYSPIHTDVPIGLAYIGPSITPFTENNPAYRLYYMDESGMLNDHETYYFNLTEANEGKRGPQWMHEYRALEKFGLENMSPESWHKLVLKLETDDKLFAEFKNIYYRHSDAKKDEKCTDKCKKYILSDLTVLHPLKHRPKRFFGRRKHSRS